MNDRTDYVDTKMNYGKHTIGVYTFQPNPADPDPIWLRVSNSGLNVSGTLTLVAAQELCAGLHRAIMEHRK